MSTFLSALTVSGISASSVIIHCERPYSLRKNAEGRNGLSKFVSSFSGDNLRISVNSSVKIKSQNSVCCPRAVALELGPAAVQWALKMCAYYILLKSGFSGTKGPEVEGVEWRLPQFKNLQQMLTGDKDEKRQEMLMKSTNKWHANTKGALVRHYRVPSIKEGKKILIAVSSVLADDDLFRDVSTHKGCRIRRESAHGESVCCNNVRALFDELPTPHLLLEITVFPPGPITSAEFQKAAKLEEVLSKGHSV